MFYSQLLLAKKGPLAKVWMAAHWDKKLTKQAIVQTDIRSSAEQLKKPQTPLSLRMSGHLLLGLSRIFARKVQYLYHDSSEAFAHMKSGTRPAIDLDTQEGGGGGANIDMPAGGAAAAAAELLMQHNEISDAQLFNFDFGGDGGAIPLVGDMADWVAFGTQQGGSQQGAPGSASRSAQRLDRSLRMGRGYAPLPHEAADEEHFDVPGLAPSGGRSAITGSGSASDAELERARLDGLARKSLAPGARGSDLDSDDNRSVVSENDDSVRRGRRARSSLLPGNADLEGGAALGAKASLKGRLSAADADAAGGGADALLLGGAAHDEFGLGDLMGLTGAGAVGGEDDADMAGGGQRQQQQFGDEGGGGYDYYAEVGGGGGAAFEPAEGAGAAAMDDEEDGGNDAAVAAGGALEKPVAQRAAARATSDASSLSAHGGSSESLGAESQGSSDPVVVAAAVKAAAAETAKASRAAKKAKRDADKLAAALRVPDTSTMLPSDTIRGWLSDTSKITRPLLEGKALAEHLQRQHEELAHARVKATMAPGPAAARRFAAMYPYPGAWSAVSTLEMLSACPPTAAHTGPDGEALRRVPLTVDVDAEFIGCYGSHGPSAPFGPASFGRTSLAMARLMISHAHGTAIYGRDPALIGDEEEDDADALGFAAAASSAVKPSKAAAAAAAAADAAAAVHPRKGGVSAADSAAAGGDADVAGEQHQQQQYGDEGGGGYDYYAEVGGGGDGAGFALNAEARLDGDLAGPGLDEHGNVRGGEGALIGRRSSAGADSPLSHAHSAGGAAAAGSVHSPPGSGAAAGGGDTGSVRSGAPGGDDEFDQAHASTPGGGGGGGGAGAAVLLSASARHVAGQHGAFLGNERTAKMLSILAEEMTGPVLPPPPEGAGSGEKRKARAAPVQYDLSDIRRGKGTPADPVSFFELAEGATAPVAALSFYQLLTLKTLDVIQIKQAEAFGDISITRTAHFAGAVEEMKKAQA